MTSGETNSGVPSLTRVSLEGHRRRANPKSTILIRKHCNTKKEETYIWLSIILYIFMNLFMNMYYFSLLEIKRIKKIGKGYKNVLYRYILIDWLLLHVFWLTDDWIIKRITWLPKRIIPCLEIGHRCMKIHSGYATAWQLEGLITNHLEDRQTPWGRKRQAVRRSVNVAWPDWGRNTGEAFCVFLWHIRGIPTRLSQMTSFATWPGTWKTTTPAKNGLK